LVKELLIATAHGRTGMASVIYERDSISIRNPKLACARRDMLNVHHAIGREQAYRRLDFVSFNIGVGLDSLVCHFGKIYVVIAKSNKQQVEL
jgi:hypothetical protein